MTECGSMQASTFTTMWQGRADAGDSCEGYHNASLPKHYYYDSVYVLIAAERKAGEEARLCVSCASSSQQTSWLVTAEKAQVH